ncbi:MAG: hypothetical protein K9J37_19010 [Saprospiraceae bacterium]|nr:hypothetical protein [Saprospiraceae bacterium]MCF8252014.1 hypothetical protein [Saprospiraceae bacterium]MCF8281703.1 hypothetical protein [Bacteroidales bacterium]MCF8313691.1 hypothetical protein [Saprospiraceae bacterium]MCF8442398.1 hypothetical protein [Saprospiraceae bacterium]
MNKIKFLTISVIALVVLNLVTVAFFWMKRPPRPMQKGPKKIIVERLHFDAQQVTAYDKLIAEHQQAIAAKSQEMGEAKKVLFALLKGDDFSKKDSLISVIGQVQQQIEATHFQHFMSIKELCKDEQLQAFKDLSSDLAKYFAPPPKGK